MASMMMMSRSIAMKALGGPSLSFLSSFQRCRFPTVRAFSALIFAIASMEENSEGERENQSRGNKSGAGNSNNEGQSKPKRQMKTPFQLEALEKAYALETYLSEALRAELSQSLNLSDRQLQMWFCHKRLKDKKVIVAADCRSFSGILDSSVAETVSVREAFSCLKNISFLIGKLS